MKSLKRRKLRQKRKKLLRRSGPVSYVLYSVATNYKHWKSKYICSKDSFYSSFFRAASKLTVAYNKSKRNVLLSGDVQLNLTVDTKEDICFGNPDFVSKYRMLRCGLKPLDVGGGGECFFK